MTVTEAKAMTSLSLSRQARLEQMEKAELVQLVEDLYTEEVAVLGDDEVFVRRDQSKRLVAVKAGVRLSVSRGEIYRSGSAEEYNYSISANGYLLINKITGLSIFTPPTVNYGEGQFANPHTHVSATGRVECVAVRKIAVGRSPIGNWAAADQTLHFRPHMYLVEALQNQVQYSPACGGYGTATTPPVQFAVGYECGCTPKGEKYSLKCAEHGKPSVYAPTLQFVEVDQGVGFWYDIMAPKIQEIFLEHTRRLKFAERIAQGICVRNCFHAHPAIAASKVLPDKDGNLIFVAIGYKVEQETTEAFDIAERLARGEKTSEDITVESAVVDQVAEEDVKAHTKIEAEDEPVQKGLFEK